MTGTDTKIPAAAQPASPVGRVLSKLPLKLVRFIAAGLPAFVVAVPLNWFLVERLGAPKTLTYAFVLISQTSFNFFLCRWFVFREEQPKPISARFVPFVGGLLLFRAADWALYTILVTYFGFWYLAVQVANAVAFSLVKFLFARKVMEN